MLKRLSISSSTWLECSPKATAIGGGSLLFLASTLTQAGSVYPTPVTPSKNEAISLMQFTAGRQVLGFAANKVYMAGLDHALIIELVNSQGNTPLGIAESISTQAGDVPGLRQVTYLGAWRGVDIIYSSGEGGYAKSAYVVHPDAHATDIRLKYNSPVQLMSRHNCHSRPKGRLPRCGFQSAVSPSIPFSFPNLRADLGEGGAPH